MPLGDRGRCSEHQRDIMRKIVAVITDTHGNSKAGLLNPETLWFAEDTNGNPVPFKPALNEVQQRLYRIYQENIDKVFDLAGSDEVILLHLGDEVDGIKYPSMKVSSRLADQFTIAEYNFLPWFTHPNLKAMRLVIGTEAHNAGEGTSSIALCNSLQAKYPHVNVSTLYHGLLTVDGVDFDYAHHGAGPGIRSWLRGNAARFYLRDIMLTDIKNNRKPPDVVLRGHCHEANYEYLEENWQGKTVSSRLYIVPSYCAFTDHSVQVTASKSSLTNGTLALEIIDGKITREFRWYDTQDVRRVEHL